MFNILVDPLPTEFEGVKVKTDYRQALKFFRILEDKTLGETEKARLIVLCMFDGRPPEDENLWKFLEYYMAGGKPKKEGSGRKTFDFDQDQNYIYSAFRQVYGIDLTVENLHWWTFLALFQSLPEGTFFSKVLEIRNREIPKGCDAMTRMEIMKQKASFQLETSETLSLAGLFKR
jgi:hypothetical protein